jgi:hydrogenase-1 operon protein HyaE
MSGLAEIRAMHPLVAALSTTHRFEALDVQGFDAFVALPGATLVVFLEDPARYRETLDLAVIAPEIARAFPGAFRTAVLSPAAAREIAPRYGLRRWPALVLLRDGGYVGAVEGLRDWSGYLDAIASLLAAPVVRPPGLGVAVRAAVIDAKEAP